MDHEQWWNLEGQDIQEHWDLSVESWEAGRKQLFKELSDILEEWTAFNDLINAIIDRGRPRRRTVTTSVETLKEE